MLLQTNPGEQFYMFGSLCAWLVRRAGKVMEQPRESDDPNTVIANILEQVFKFVSFVFCPDCGAQVREVGVAVQFPPSKLKQGYGEPALTVLEILSKQALAATNFCWQKPVYLSSNDIEEDESDEDEGEIILEKVEEELMEQADSEDDISAPQIDPMDLSTFNIIGTGCINI